MTINETDSQPQAELKVSSGPGVLLREAREAKGWTQVEVARRLNLRLAVIESIDSDHYKAGVALTFLRGYVKAYAKVVGVPEAQALAAFDSMSHEQFKTPEPMKSFSKKTRQQASDKWLKRISWLVFLGLLSSLIYWWWHDGGASQQSRQFEPELVPPAELSVSESDESLPPVSLETLPAEQDALNALDTVPANETEAASLAATNNDLGTPALVARPIAPSATAATERLDTAPAANVAEVIAAPANEVAAASANARLLTLSFTADCWIKVTDSQGKVLSEGVKNAQQSLALEGEPPFKVILGVPTAVRAEYLGKAVDLSSFGAGRAARLTVPQS